MLSEFHCICYTVYQVSLLVPVYMNAELFVYIALVLQEFISVILFTERFILVMTIWRDVMHDVRSTTPLVFSNVVFARATSLTHKGIVTSYFTKRILYVGSFSPL